MATLYMPVETESYNMSDIIVTKKGNCVDYKKNIQMMKEMKRLGYGVVIGTDCHNAAQLNFGYELTHKLLTDCGFKYKYILTDDGFVPVPL